MGVSITLAFKQQRQEDGCKFEASLTRIVSSRVT